MQAEEDTFTAGFTNVSGCVGRGVVFIKLEFFVYLFLLNDRPEGSREQPIRASWFARITLPASAASWHKATFCKFLRRSENVILKICLDKYFLDSTVFALAFLSCEKGLTVTSLNH